MSEKQPGGQRGQNTACTCRVKEGKAGPITRGQIMFALTDLGRTEFYPDGKPLIERKWVKDFFFTPFYFAYSSVYRKTMCEEKKCISLN